MGLLIAGAPSHRRDPRQIRSARSRAAIISRASCSAERGLVVGAHRARITFEPFRATAASMTMLATSAGSTRSSEIRGSAPYSAARVELLLGDALAPALRRARRRNELLQLLVARHQLGDERDDLLVVAAGQELPQDREDRTSQLGRLRVRGSAVGGVGHGAPKVRLHCTLSSGHLLSPARPRSVRRRGRAEDANVPPRETAPRPAPRAASPARARRSPRATPPA